MEEGGGPQFGAGIKSPKAPGENRGKVAHFVRVARHVDHLAQGMAAPFRQMQKHPRRRKKIDLVVQLESIVRHALRERHVDSGVQNEVVHGRPDSPEPVAETIHPGKLGQIDAVALDPRPGELHPQLIRGFGDLGTGAAREDQSRARTQNMSRHRMAQSGVASGDQHARIPQNAQGSFLRRRQAQCPCGRVAYRTVTGPERAAAT